MWLLTEPRLNRKRNDQGCRSTVGREKGPTPLSPRFSEQQLYSSLTCSCGPISWMGSSYTTPFETLPVSSLLVIRLCEHEEYIGRFYSRAGPIHRFQGFAPGMGRLSCIPSPEYYEERGEGIKAVRNSGRECAYNTVNRHRIERRQPFVDG